MKNTVFTGSGTALITPFKDDGERVDYDFFEAFCEFQIKNHTDALIVAGTTGESPVLSKDEKNGLFELAVKTANGKVPVIAGTGSNNTEEAVKKSNEAEKTGVNALLVVTPYYNKCTQEGIIEHYYYIADRVSHPLIVYNVPSRTGVNILPETYKALSEHKNIVAVKEANGNLSSIAETISLCGDALQIYSGNDDQTVPINSLGGKGVISVAANIIPEDMHKIAINGEDSARMQLYYYELMKELFCEVNPIPIKAAVQMIWQKEQPLRLPLTKISEINKGKLKATLKKYNLI